ncbi:hypothetical protein ACHAXR_006422 [Thalassiosira sp. AJA248-18]
MFSWSGRPTPVASSASPSRTPPSSSISRSVHLSSYIRHPILEPSTRKVSSDDTMYDTVFQTMNGFALILRVFMPTDAGRAPTMTLHGVRASHSWLDIRMKVIGYAPISTDQRWKQSNLKLGDAVYNVIQHFQLTPPSLSEIVDDNLRRLQESLAGPRPGPSNNTFPPSASAGFQGSNGSRQNNSRPVSQPVQNGMVEEKVNFEVDDYEVNALIPPIPSSFEEINTMTLSEAKQVVENKAVLESFVESTSGVKTLKELKQSIETANVNTAKSNLNHEEQIKGLFAEVETLKQDLNSKMQQYRKLDGERLSITNPPDLQEAIGELNKAKKDAYRESEELADGWVESGGENVSDFVNNFMEVRLLYHTRAAKAERLEMSMCIAIRCGVTASLPVRRVIMHDDNMTTTRGNAMKKTAQNAMFLLIVDQYGAGIRACMLNKGHLTQEPHFEIKVIRASHPTVFFAISIRKENASGDANLFCIMHCLGNLLLEDPGEVAWSMAAGFV